MRLTLALVTALLAGCTENESTEERYADLAAKTELVCWSYSWGFPCAEDNDVPADRAAQCMNDAVSSGTVAKASSHDRSTIGHAHSDTTVFTVDHQVVVFEFDDPEDPSAATGINETTCTGPFRVAEGICPTGSTITVLAWDGCP